MAERHIARRVGRSNRNLRLTGRSWLYFTQQGESGPVKIGRTRQLTARINALSVTSAFELRLLGTIPETWLSEERAHRVFARHRIKGEWFEPIPGILELAEAGRRIFANGYVDTTDDDEAWLTIRRAA